MLSFTHFTVLYYNSNNLWENSQKLRLLKGLSRDDLAERCEIHITYLAGVERGERNITIESLEKISIGLEASLQEIVSFHTLTVDNTEYYNKKEALIILMDKVATLNIIELDSLSKIIDGILEFKKTK